MLLEAPQWQNKKKHFELKKTYSVIFTKIWQTAIQDKPESHAPNLGQEHTECSMTKIRCDRVNSPPLSLISGKTAHH